MPLELLTIFAAGLGTFVTPCVLPLVPIYLAALIGGDVAGLGKASRGQLAWRGSLFSVGFIAVFTAMGLGASLVGAFLTTHRAGVQVVGAVVILLFALKFLGLVRLPWLDRTVKADEQRVRTRFASVNAMLMGVVFAAGWSPCVGPVLGAVLTYTAATTASPLVGAGYLSIYGLGFALPLVLVAAFAEAGLGALKRIRPQLPRIEKGVGVLLVLIAALLVHDASAAWTTSPAAAAAEDAVDGPVAGSEAPAGPVMVELYTPDCPICQRMAPMVEQLSHQCAARDVEVRTVDVSRPEHRHLVSRYRVRGVPTFIFLDEQGEETARLVGEQPAATLRQALATLSGEPCPGVALLPLDSPPAPPAGDGPADGSSCATNVVAHQEPFDDGSGAACGAPAAATQ